jgi:hypothetical protein
MIAYDAAFAGLHCDIDHAIADGSLVAVNSPMNGRHSEHVALVGFGDRARAALGHAPSHPSMEMPVHVSRSRGGRTFLDAALAVELSQRRQVSLTLPGRLQNSFPSGR